MIVCGSYKTWLLSIVCTLVCLMQPHLKIYVMFVCFKYNNCDVGRAVARTVIGGGGDLYINVLSDEFLFKLRNLN